MTTEQAIMLGALIVWIPAGLINAHFILRNQWAEDPHGTSMFSIPIALLGGLVIWPQAMITHWHQELDQTIKKRDDVLKECAVLKHKNDEAAKQREALNAVSDR